MSIDWHNSSVVSEKNMENTQNLRTFWEFLLQNFYKSYQNFAANRSADLFYLINRISRFTVIMLLLCVINFCLQKLLFRKFHNGAGRGPGCIQNNAQASGTK